MRVSNRIIPPSVSRTGVCKKNKERGQARALQVITISVHSNSVITIVTTVAINVKYD